MTTCTPKLALIDLDPLLYQYGYCQLPDGRPLSGTIAAKAMMNKIEDITNKAGCYDWFGYVSGSGNFRESIATIKDYKGNRKDREKPPLYAYLKGYLISEHSRVRVSEGCEADDCLSIHQMSQLSGEDCNTVICTLDKDLEMVPGYHYRWERQSVKEIPTWYQTEIGGLRAFYKQCLTGDGVDNIPGLYGIGPKSAYLSRIDGFGDEAAMFELVQSLYQKWYGNYGDKFLLEVGRLLWMQRYEGELWSFPEVKGV